MSTQKARTNVHFHPPLKGEGFPAPENYNPAITTDARVAERETEVAFLRLALIHAMAYIIRNRRGVLTPDEEARRYATLLAEAGTALAWSDDATDTALDAA